MVSPFVANVLMVYDETSALGTKCGFMYVRNNSSAPHVGLIQLDEISQPK